MDWCFKKIEASKSAPFCSAPYGLAREWHKKWYISGAYSMAVGAWHMLSQGFDIFSIHIQYWMLLVAVIATIAIAYIRRWLKSRL
jgi:hypothetical protein